MATYEANHQRLLELGREARRLDAVADGRVLWSDICENVSDYLGRAEPETGDLSDAAVEWWSEWVAMFESELDACE